jgi:hypothetical protein
VHILVVQHCDLKREVLLEVLHHHDEKGQLDAENDLGVRRARNERRRHVRAADLEHGRLNVRVSQALDMAIFHCEKMRRKGGRRERRSA